MSMGLKRFSSLREFGLIGVVYREWEAFFRNRIFLWVLKQTDSLDARLSTRKTNTSWSVNVTKQMNVNLFQLFDHESIVPLPLNLCPNVTLHVQRGHNSCQMEQCQMWQKIKNILWREQRVEVAGIAAMDPPFKVEILNTFIKISSSGC